MLLHQLRGTRHLRIFERRGERIDICARHADQGRGGNAFPTADGVKDVRKGSLCLLCRQG